jgi:hypothetical protein
LLKEVCLTLELNFVVETTSRTAIRPNLATILQILMPAAQQLRLPSKAGDLAVQSSWPSLTSSLDLPIHKPLEVWGEPAGFPQESAVASWQPIQDDVAGVDASENLSVAAAKRAVLPQEARNRDFEAAADMADWELSLEDHSTADWQEFSAAETIINVSAVR